MSGEKSRNLTIFEYFEKLQLEYIVAELRKKIYPVIRDKKYYERVMKAKKEKILDIASRNTLPSIFDTEIDEGDTRIEMYQKIYKEEGLPKFLYRDETDRDRMMYVNDQGGSAKEYSYKELDIINYYMKGSEVKVILEGITHIGNIVDFNVVAELVEVRLREETRNYPMEKVTRIL